MARSNRHVDLLEPIRFEEHAPKLRLYLSQVCELAGISKMQLDYWTIKADIPTQGKKQRIYDYGSILFVMLIKQARDKGLSLPAAIDAAREFLYAQQEAAEPIRGLDEGPRDERLVSELPEIRTADA